MSDSLRVIFAGTPEFAAEALAKILAAGHTVPLVLTQPDRPAGRGMKLQASAVKQLAVQHNIPVAQPLSLRLDGKYPDDAAAAQAAIAEANADVMVVAAQTEDAQGKPGISMFVVTADMPGFSKGRNLHKIGQHAQDTAELFFADVRVPADHLLGEINKGFRYMMQELPQERLCISVNCQARAEAVFEWTQNYVKDRKAFKQRIADFQNTRFKLASLYADLQAGRALCDSMIARQLKGELDAVGASAGKLWHSEMLGRVTDECLQLHGGYGYMQEYMVAKAYCDARIERIYAGTSEIMKEIIARSICDEPKR